MYSKYLVIIFDNALKYITPIFFYRITTGLNNILGDVMLLSYGFGSIFISLTAYSASVCIHSRIVLYIYIRIKECKKNYNLKCKYVRPFETEIYETN